MTATRLCAAPAAIRSRKNLALAAHEGRSVEENCRRLSVALGDDRFEDEWSKGEAMTLEEVAAYARAALQPERTP